MTPGAAKKKYQRGQINLPRAEYLRAANIEHAVRKYVGGTEEAKKHLGIL